MMHLQEARDLDISSFSGVPSDVILGLTQKTVPPWADGEICAHREAPTGQRKEFFSGMPKDIVYTQYVRVCVRVRERERLSVCLFELLKSWSGR